MLSKTQLSNKIDSNNLNERILILEKFYHITVCSGQDKPVSLTKQSDLKQNYSSPTNLKYNQRGLVAENNNVYRTIRKKMFAVF